MKVVILQVKLFLFISLLLVQSRIFADSSFIKSDCDAQLSMFVEFDAKNRKVNVKEHKYRVGKDCRFLLNELNANLSVKIYDINNVLINSGKFFISEEVFIEKKTRKGKIKRVRSSLSEKVYRLVKVSFKTPKERIINVKMYDLKSNKLLGDKVLHL